MVAGAFSEVVAAAEAASRAVMSGGKLAYAGAGSSGLMALADGLELPGMFGVDADRIVLLFAGGTKCLERMVGGPDDDVELAEADARSSGLSHGDCTICVSASGSTPYTLAVQRHLGKLGVNTVAIANNANSPLLNEAQFPITLHTPPEIIAGSTRMGAATAQKIALNMLSTLMAVELGHVHDGMIVNLLADNEKLRQRAIGIVAEIAGCSTGSSAKYIEEARGSVKIAVLLAGGSASLKDAETLLEKSGGKLWSVLRSI